MCYYGFMASGSELASVSSGTQRDAAPREVLYAKQGCANVSLAIAEPNSLEDVHFHSSTSSCPDYPMFSEELCLFIYYSWYTIL